jgi:hypothetical protein
MQFSIRDLFLVTLIVALAAGWWLDRRAIQQDRDVWKYHAAGAQEIVRSHRVNEIEINGKEMVGRKNPSGESLARTWPDVGWLYDIPSARSLPNSSAPAPDPPKP